MSVLLETERLLLRPPKAADISHFVPLLNDFEVSKNLSRVPYPYTEDDACAFIVRVAHGRAAGTDYAFAILLKAAASSSGCAASIRAQDWEFGYWLGKPYLGHRLCHRSGSARREFRLRGPEDGDAERRLVPRQSGIRARAREARIPDAGEAEMSCVSRGCTVNCHRVALDRATYMTRKMTP